MGGGRKLISLWLCSLALAACTDTLDEAAVPKPLSVAVNARDITARVPIHGTALPDASNIGISLVAEDGTPYDGVAYDNLKYTAAGTAPDQSWSTPNVPTLSSNTAKLVAYYPWAENTDYSAVPVETDTQTDYMYSQWLTGLSNANPNANIVMKHALTAVRVALVKGDFTADVDVSSVSVKSPAFATAGAMDATTGALSGLTGIGDVVTVAADFPLTAQATNVEVMAVPDVTVSSGVTTVTTQIGDRKYSVNINFTESYKQGYIYTYTLTLNNTGMEVTSVAVTPWEEGTTDNGTLEVGYNENEYVVNILSETDNFTYSHNMVDFTGTIDWGDGTQTTYDSKTSYPSHTYTTAGTYRVVATGMATALNSTSASKCITDIIKIGGEMGFTSMYYAFANQTKLTEIPAGLFEGQTDILTFEGAFSGCKVLTNIPGAFFKNCSGVTTFKDTFNGCTGLKSVSADLFEGCINVEYYFRTFAGCSNLNNIPEGLFSYSPDVLEFGGVFVNCTALTNISENIFRFNTKAIDMRAAFQGCTGLMEIPVNLFRYNIANKSFHAMFAGCTGITSIPEDLFKYNIEVTKFETVFDGCTGITEIPGNLFKYNIKASNFYGVFINCYGLESIPEGLFSYNKEAETFLQAFDECPNLKSTIPDGFFKGLSKVTTFEKVFDGCPLVGDIPANLFEGCISAKNFKNAFSSCRVTAIPEGLFKDCTEATNFAGTFWGCGNLTKIPTDLWDTCRKVTDFSGNFVHCYLDAGESPYSIINVDGNDVKVHLYERANYPEHFTAPTKGSLGYCNWTDKEAIKAAGW